MNTTNSIYQTNILQKKQKKKTEGSLSGAQIAFNVMFVLIWIRHTLLSFVLQVFYSLPYIQRIAEYIFPITIIFLTLMALPYIKKHIHLTDILFMFLGMLLLVASPVIWPENAEYLSESTWQIMTAVLPLYLVGLCYDHESLKKPLFFASLAGCATMLLYQIYQLLLNREIAYDGMGQAYYTLPCVMYLVYYAFEQRKLKYWLFALAGIVFVSSFGARGPVFIVLVFLAVQMFIKIVNSKSGVFKFFFIIGAFLCAYLILSGNLITKLAEFLSDKISDIGLSTRVFDYFLSGNLADGSGRFGISQKILEAIKAHPAFGYGLMGDRAIMANGGFAHNLFLELWCQFGVIFGTIIALAIVLIPVFSIKKQKDPSFSNFLLMLSCTVLIKLMGSSSFLLEPHLFLLLGISIPIITNRKNKQS